MFHVGHSTVVIFVFEVWVDMCKLLYIDDVYYHPNLDLHNRIYLHCKYHSVLFSDISTGQKSSFYIRFVLVLSCLWSARL